jgi:mannose-6-phosphate isomerase-like protein (cupin superfamily)
MKKTGATDTMAGRDDRQPVGGSILAKADPNYTVIDRELLPRDGNTYEFEGLRYQDTKVSFIWVDLPPGDAIKLHKHPYREIFIIQEGMASFTIGSAALEAHAGQIVIVPAGVPHKFMNTGDRQLRQIDIHVNRQIITHWLEY